MTVLAAFGRRLERWALRVEDLDEDVVDRFVRKTYPERRPPRPVRPTLRRLLAMLRDMGIARPGSETQPLSPAEQLLSEYKHFLVKERAISTSTVDRWSRVALRFLIERFGSGPVDTGTFTASDITGFVQRQSHLHGHSMARSLVVGMRSFLRYLEYKGLTALSLDKAVPAVATWTMSTLPKYLSFEQVQTVLDHCDRSTKAGRRNHAILLLLARLGLRAGEVVKLELEDIDWDNALITISGKGGQRAQLPLLPDVGRAIAEYLHGDRPPSSCRRVFIRDYAPRTGFGRPGAIANLVKRALQRAGIESAHKGAHLLRHSLATHMLAKGASLGEIGEILRHKSTDTTAIYAKVELEALRPLAMLWPGGME